MFFGDRWMASFVIFFLKVWSIFSSLTDAENVGTQTIANFHDNEIDSFGSVSMGSRLFSKHGILGSECTAFVQASLWHMLSCFPAQFFGSKILFIKRGTVFSIICKSITMQFCHDRGNDKEKETRQPTLAS